jgi:hypothetical protein
MHDSPRPQRTQRYRSGIIDAARWDGLQPRDDDIIISTPPKAGTTWTQMICALLIFQETDLPAPLTTLSPWLDLDSAPIDKVLDSLEGQRHRRFIKTHTPLDGLEYRDETTYLCVGRDPRDAFMSMDNHMQNVDPEFLKRSLDPERLAAMAAAAAEAPQDLAGKFRAWIADDGLPWQGEEQNGASEILYHVQSFWRFRHRPNIHLFHYSDLKADLDGEMRRMADALGIRVASERWPEFVKAASFESMKARADTLAPEVDKGVWQDTARFFNKGSNGQWSEFLSDAELALYREAMSERLEPELAEWLEKGRLGSDGG